MSPEYYNFLRRLVLLQKHLLPPIKPVYSDEEYDKTRGFITLVHAEIEAFVEDRCSYVLTETRTRWQASRNANRILFALYAMCYSGWSALNDDMTALPKLSRQFDLAARVGSSFTQYEHLVSDNNGITEPNLKKLLIPLSIRLSDLDPNWLIEMTNFGSSRGGVVHKSWKANQPPDPGTVSTLIRTILLPGLNRLDRELTAVLAAAGPQVQTKRIRDRVLSAYRMIATGRLS